MRDPHVRVALKDEPNARRDLAERDPVVHDRPVVGAKNYFFGAAAGAGAAPALLCRLDRTWLVMSTDSLL